MVWGIFLRLTDGVIASIMLGQFTQIASGMSVDFRILCFVSDFGLKEFIYANKDIGPHWA